MSKPDLAEPQRAVATLENPAVFKQELVNAGFKNVEVRCVTLSFPVASISEFWANMVKGSAPILMMKKNMSEAVWQEKEILALDYLKERLPTTPTALTSDAWLGLGIK